MAAVRAYLLSMLALRRHGQKDAFPGTYPHPWLIWEPGVWQPAGSGPDPSQTQAANPASYHPKSTGDALCFELAERRPLKIGRGKGCDIQINDATVSREHLVVEPESLGAGWTATPSTTSNTTELNGAKLSRASLPLRARDQLRLGDVLVTFVDPGAMLERLEDHLRKAESGAR
jgi:FHA domain-containing protein